MKIPVREIFLKIHLWLNYLVSEIEISLFYAITIRHFENLCPCDTISFDFLAKMLLYSLKELCKLFTDIYFHIQIFDSYHNLIQSSQFQLGIYVCTFCGDFKCLGLLLRQIISCKSGKTDYYFFKSPPVWKVLRRCDSINLFLELLL